MAMGGATLSLDELDGIADASDFAEVVADRYGPFPVAIVVDDLSRVLRAIELNDSWGCRGVIGCLEDVGAPPLTASFEDSPAAAGRESVLMTAPICAGADR